MGRVLPVYGIAPHDVAWAMRGVMRACSAAGGSPGLVLAPRVWVLAGLLRGQGAPPLQLGLRIAPGMVTRPVWAPPLKPPSGLPVSERLCTQAARVGYIPHSIYCTRPRDGAPDSAVREFMCVRGL